jgi:hypothetical protein
VFFSAKLKNTCGHPISITVPNTGQNDKISDHQLDNGDQVEVLHLNCFGTRSIFSIGAFVSALKEVKSCLVNDYTLEINSNDNRISL